MNFLRQGCRMLSSDNRQTVRHDRNCIRPGAQPRLKSLGPNTGSPPPAVRVRGYYPRKIFETSDAKSCNMVTTCCEISCFLKTTAKKLGRPIHCWFSNLKVGGPVSRGPYGCCACVYDAAWRVVMSVYCSNESDWWEAENEHGEVGAIPRNYVTSDNDAKETQT